ncbi:MAG: thymidine phosphorylase [Propionibacteriaceae bacterium]|jgi:thymidine phosphorylase|nr:thymidine phosphorylase [Propionibacteriaceae bacterium]
MTDPAAERSFATVDLIAAKRDHHDLSDPAIAWLIDGYTAGRVADEQMAAMAMAIYLNGLNDRELRAWTAAMLASGERLDFSDLAKPTADKHSTGGVGDKITLILTPLVSCFGVAVPQLSGRGLGYTGGTLDKMESIPGWQAQLTNDQMRRQLSEVGAVICAAGAGLAPADRKLYALRDVTGTVSCRPLIASSIISKKLAEGTGVLALDVKCGSGAFMADLVSAQALAATLVDLGQAGGVDTVALITDMSTPLGLTVGNALEVREAVEVLAGGGPSDVIALTVKLAEAMLHGVADRAERLGVPGAGLAPGSPVLARLVAGWREADPALALRDGRAMDQWRAMVTAQGGDPQASLPKAHDQLVIRAEQTGYVNRLDALAVGVAAWRLGAGRAKQGDPLLLAAGVELHAQRGDWAEVGTPLLTLHSDDPDRLPAALAALDAAIGIDDQPAATSDMVLETIVK